MDKKIETAEDLTHCTEAKPAGDQITDLLFANKVAKHLKSNTIVLAKGQQLLGMGCGQTSRIDACHQAIEKAGKMGFDLEGAVMASDAFFPFRDGIDNAASFGVSCVIQPGGSMRDEEVIAAANEHGMAMVFTGVRHFRH